MNTPLTTAEIVERLTTDSDLLDAWATWELGALPVPGPMNHADIATNLRTAASALLALEGEREAAEAELAKVRTALEPFARCSEVYPNADDTYEAGFGALYDPRCPLTLGDFRRARAALSEKTV